MRKGNVIVGQSGGPTAVINSSLAGVYKASLENGAKKVYGMLHGVQGLIEGRYVDLADHIFSQLGIELLRRTPSSFLGSCRHKLPEIHANEETYEKIFKVLKDLDIKYFFYIGGNDSMDTIKKLSDYAKIKNVDINFMGVPKTIDNDLAVTDHTPGFGSAAKYIASSLKEVIRDCFAYDQRMVTVVEIMGRNAGWLTASAALSKTEDCPGPDLVFVPEIAFDMNNFIKMVDEREKERKSIIIAVSEGLRLSDGRYVCELRSHVMFTDSFGHKSLSGTAQYLSEFLARELGCKTRPIELSTLQRCAAHLVSRTDNEEAFLTGGRAVQAAFAGETAKMIIMIRTSNDPYHIIAESCDIAQIANIEKKIPRDWLDGEGTYVTKEFLTYCKPLIQGELLPVMVDGLPRHLYL